MSESRTRRLQSQRTWSRSICSGVGTCRENVRIKDQEVAKSKNLVEVNLLRGRGKEGRRDRGSASHLGCCLLV